MTHPEPTIERQQKEKRWESWEEGAQAAKDVLFASHDTMTGAMSSREFKKLRADGSSKFQFCTDLQRGVGYDLCDRRDPQQMMVEFMTRVNGLQKEIGDNSYSFVLDEEERLQAIDGARAVRRSDMAVAKYLLLKEWRQYIADLRDTTADGQQQAYCDTWNEVIEAAAEQLMTDECAIANPEVMKTIRRVGTQIDREGDEPITEEQLVYVRAQTSHLPAFKDDALQLTTPYKAGVGNRNSIHGALNHYVEGHTKGSWHDVSSVVVIPFQELMSQQKPTSLNEVDTYFFGEVELNFPEGTVVVIKEGDEQWNMFLSEHPELEKRYTIIRVADPQAVRAASSVAMLRMGYSVIPGGDSGSADQSVRKRMNQLAKEQQTTEGGIPHFYSKSDTIDMMHGAVLLDRAKKEHGGDGWVQKVDWTGDTNMIRAQLAELINSIKAFFNVIVDVDFAAFNLPEARKKDLMDAVVDLIQGTETANETEGDEQYELRSAQKDLGLIAKGILRSYRDLALDKKAILATIAPEAAAYLESVTESAA